MDSLDFKIIGKTGKKKKVQFPLEQPKSTREEEEKQECEKLGSIWARQEPEEEGATLELMEWEKTHWNQPGIATRKVWTQPVTDYPGINPKVPLNEHFRGANPTFPRS